MRAHQAWRSALFTGLSLLGVGAAHSARGQTPIAVTLPASGEGAEAGSGAVIVVTGSANPVPREEVGSALSVLEGDRLAAQGFAFVQDALRAVPGVAVNQSGSFGSLTQVRIRGAEGRHTLVLIDGIEVSSIGQGEFDFSSLLANSIARVEVLRGPQSGLYGANAMGGVINIITRGGEGPRFDGASEAGSFGSFMGRRSVTFGDRTNYISASGIARSARGFSSAASGTEPDGDRNLTGYLRGGVQIAPFARLDASLRFVDKNTAADGFDFSGGPLHGLPIDADSFSDTQEWSGGAALTIDLSDRVQSVFTGSFNDFQFVGGTGAVAQFGNVGQRFRLNGQTTWRTTTGPHLAHALTAFLDYEEERFRNAFPFDPSQSPALGRSILGVGLEYRAALLDSLFLNGALRHDRNDQFADATTYMINGSWVIRKTGTRLHASHGTGAANPTFAQQFGFVPGMFTGNPALRPERKTGFDFGVEQKIGKAILADITYFRSSLEDEIVAVFPTVLNDLGQSLREGVEFVARVDLGPLDFGGSYTYTNAFDPDGTREVRRPEHMAAFDANYSFAPENRANLNFGLIYNGQMLDNDFRQSFQTFAPQKTMLPEYFVARLAGSYQLSRRIRLSGRVENLLDANYQEAIGFAVPGQSAFVGLQMALR